MIKQKIAEMEQGCGKYEDMKIKGLTVKVSCGDNGFEGKVALCDNCLVKYKSYLEAIKDVKTLIKKKIGKVEKEFGLRNEKKITVLKEILEQLE